MKIIKGKCQYCGKVIESLYQGQFDYNMKAHESTCKKKPEVEKDE